MCDWATQQLVEQIVQDKCQAEARFTALDVSLEARKRGSTERHRDMKHVVHQCFAQGAMGPGYQRTLIAIPGAPARAWLYHQVVDDPNDYQPLDRSTFPRRRANGTGADGAYHVDKRLRICVPVRFLRRAGLRPGENVLAVAASRSRRLLLTRTAPQAPAYRVVGAYTVEKNGNVRILQGTLRKANLAGSAYAVDGDQRRVVVRLHPN